MVHMNGKYELWKLLLAIVATALISIGSTSLLFMSKAVSRAEVQMMIDRSTTQHQLDANRNDETMANLLKTVTENHIDVVQRMARLEARFDVYAQTQK